MAQPTNSPDAANCIIGKGKLAFKRYGTDGSDGKDFIPLGNVNKVTVQPDDTRAELYDSQDSAAGLYAAATTRRKVTLTAVGNEFHAANLALMTMGDSAFFTQSSATVSGEPLSAAAKLGAYYKLANRNVSAVVLKQGATTLDAGDDYEVVDATTGVVWLKPTGAATGGSALTADYTAAAITGTAVQKVQAFTQNQIVGGLLYIGDSSFGPSWDAEWWKASVKPQGELGLIQDEFGEFTLEFDILKDASQAYGGTTAEPYGRLIAK